jgi:adenosylhomocysteine nucleosidase
MGAVIRPFAKEGAGISETDFRPLPIEIYDRRTKSTRKVKEFPCDENLLAIAKSVKARDWVRKGQDAKAAPGVIGSADEWNNQLDRIALLRERYGTAAEDMESAAAAQLCYSYGLPFLGIRILSNSIVNGEEFDESVGVDGQKFVLDFVNTSELQSFLHSGKCLQPEGFYGNMSK